MKTINFILAFFIVLSVSAQDSKWDFDKSHSKVTFSVSHMMISEIEGNFSKYSGTVLSDKSDFSDASVDFTIDVSSINTEDAGRDKHLISADFFNVEKYPSIIFKSKTMKKNGKDKYIMTGDLTMLGVTKTVTLDVKYGGTVKDPWGNTKAGFKISGVINRTLWGLRYNSVMDSGNMMVGENVTIECNVELKKQ